MILIERQASATAADSKTVRVYGFDVPAGVEALALRFDFQPRVSTDRDANAPLVEAAFELHTRRRRALIDEAELARHRQALGVDRRAAELNNLMNVVLIDPSGVWRGRWDRNPASTSGALTLARDHASPGFLPGAIEPGRWTAAIECHGIFGTEPVRYELRVDARGALTGEAIEEIERAKGRAGNAACARPHLHADGDEGYAEAAVGVASGTTSKRRGPGWYFGEMHCHTVHSDGKYFVEELCARIAAVGADFVCLTDHNTLSGHLDPGPLPATLVRSCELTTFRGHYPVYGISEMVPWHEEGRVFTLADMAPRVRAQGGVVGIAHPFVPGDPLCTGCRMPDGLDPADFDTMEVWYRRWESPGADNEASYAMWDRLWREGRRVTGVGARDVHGPEQEGPFPGSMPLTGIWAEDNTADAILDGLRRGRVIVSGGPVVELALRGVGTGALARIGETLETDEAPAIVVTIERLDGPAELRVLRGGELVRRIDGVREGTCELDGVADMPSHYRVELWSGASPRAITNHVVWSSRKKRNTA